TTRRVVILSCLYIFLLEFQAGLQIPSALALLEQRLCYDVQPGLPWPPASDDPACKTTQVQGRLASFRGLQSSLDVIPGLLTTIPYGMLSDTWGRRPILILATVGYTLSVAFQIFVFSFGPVFPAPMLFCSTIFMFIGGSPSTMSAMIFTSIADVTAVSSRADVFFAVSATYIASEVLSSPLAGLILLHSAWGLLITSFGILLATFVITMLFPETGTMLGAKSRTQTMAASSDAEGSVPEPAQAGRCQSTVEKISRIWRYVSTNKRLVALTISLVFVVLGRFVQEMLLQYTTKRYNWTWSQASFVLTIRSISNFIVLTVVMPLASRLLLMHRRGRNSSSNSASATSKDVWIARVSGVLGIIGFSLIGFAYTPVILCTGLVVVSLSGGMSSVLRSLLNSLVEPRHLGRLNAVLGIMELASLLVAAPALSQSLRAGLRLGGMWIGLPFMCAAAIMTVSTGVVWLVSI
ncbi:major facilitator superfamily domain-containing protein, partial [Microdochium trichocladiopsis]